MQKAKFEQNCSKIRKVDMHYANMDTKMLINTGLDKMW